MRKYPALVLITAAAFSGGLFVATTSTSVTFIAGDTGLQVIDYIFRRMNIVRFRQRCMKPACD